MPAKKAAASSPRKSVTPSAVLTAYKALRTDVLKSGKKGKRVVTACAGGTKTQDNDRDESKDYQCEDEMTYQEVETTEVLEEGDRLLQEVTVGSCSSSSQPLVDDRRRGHSTAIQLIDSLNGLIPMCVAHIVCRRLAETSRQRYALSIQLAIHLRDILDTPLLLQYACDLLIHCQKVCQALWKTLEPFIPAEMDVMSMEIIQMDENTEQMAQYTLWSKIIGVVCEL